MKNTQPITDDLDRLGHLLRERPTRVANVMSEIHDGTVERSNLRRIPLQKLITAAIAASVVFVVGMWLSRPTSLYAQTVRALSKVRSIHVEGWTTEIVRKWPLEKPVEQIQPSRIPVECWYWIDGETPTSHERFGPVVLTRTGSQLREYQEDADLLFTAEANAKDYVDRFSSMADHLQLLKDEGARTEDLGITTEEGKSLRGIRIHRGGGPFEYWFDTSTNLPVRYAQVSGVPDGEEYRLVLNFTYDQEVPTAVASFQPPKTTHVRHGSGQNEQQLVWHRHVQDISVQLRDRSIEKPIAILPRESNRAFAYQYTKPTPDGEHWVLPLDQDQYAKLSVKNFIKLRVQGAGGERSPEFWRIDDGLLDIEFPRSDLVYTKETPWQEWVRFALDHVGLEYKDVREERVFWIAKHDGRKLKPWQDVDPPVPHLIQGGKVQRGVVRPGIGHQLSPETMHGLFRDFNWMQNAQYKADAPIIVDQTELPRAPQRDRDQYPTWQEFKQAVNYDQYYVATDSPWFSGEESRQMARDWYEKEFGVTMMEERREVTMHVIQRQQ